MRHKGINLVPVDVDTYTERIIGLLEFLHLEFGVGSILPPQTCGFAIPLLPCVCVPVWVKRWNQHPV